MNIHGLISFLCSPKKWGGGIVVSVYLSVQLLKLSSEIAIIYHKCSLRQGRLVQGPYRNTYTIHS